MIYHNYIIISNTASGRIENENLCVLFVFRIISVNKGIRKNLYALNFKKNGGYENE